MAETPTPLVLANARVIDPERGLDAPGSVILAGGRVLAAGPEALNQGAPEGARVMDLDGAVAAPGLIDVGVVVGEPGAEHRETLASASRAAAAGGVTTILTAPETDPVIDDPALVDFMLRRARDTAIVNVRPLAALTKGLAGEEMAEIGLLQEAGAVAFSNGRHSVTHAGIMRRMLTYARDFDALVMHHTEDPDLAGSGVVNESLSASWKGLPSIPREAEIIMLERDLRLVGLTRGRYHAETISCGESVRVLARARDAGLNVTAATSVNHLTLNETDIGPYRTFFKMSPPLRSEEERQALVAGLADGTIDILVSGHNPQDVETKRHPFADAADGAIGLETLLPASLRMVHAGDLDLLTLLAAMTINPARRFGLEGGRLAAGAPADVVIFDPDRPWLLEKDKLHSRSKNTPFEEARFSGKVLTTIVAGHILDA